MANLYEWHRALESNTWGTYTVGVGIKIELGDVEWLGTRRLDLLGPRFIFKAKAYADKAGRPQNFFRAVHRGQKEQFWKLYNKESVKQIFRKSFVQEEKPVRSMAFSGPDAYRYPIILEAASLGEIPKISEITFERRVRMAKLWIEINQCLLADELGLIDAHFGNFAFDDSFRPKWCDFGSVRELAHGYEGFEEFRASHLRPLALAARSPDVIELILASTFSRKQKLSLLFGRLGRILNARFVGRFFLIEDLLMKALGKLGFSRAQKHFMVGYRRRVLTSFLNQLDRLPKPAPKTGYWSGYRGGGVINQPHRVLGS